MKEDEKKTKLPGERAILRGTIPGLPALEGNGRPEKAFKIIALGYRYPPRTKDARGRKEGKASQELLVTHQNQWRT